MSELWKGLSWLKDHQVEALYFDWEFWARKEQLPPEGDWTTWLLIGGRGSGKTRAGAEWVKSLAEEGVTPIALVGETMTEAVSVMVRGESGLLNIHPPAARPVLRDMTLTWPNGVEAKVMAASDPERFRGPQFAAAWCDELGCGAVDKGANQPNIFGDDKSAESGRPYFSRGLPDALMQRQFLRAHLRHWSAAGNNPAGMVDPSRVYLWTWDARPFPAFPAQIEVWADGPNHRTGHWLTGRLGGMASDELAGAIAADQGVVVEAEVAQPFVHGYALTQARNGRDALEPLVVASGLSLRADVDGLTLRQARRRATVAIGRDGLAEGDGPVLSRRRNDPAEVAGRLALSFTDRERDYLAGTVTALRGAGPLAGEALPLVLDTGGARTAAEQVLLGRGPERESVDFVLPPSALRVEVGDVIAIGGETEGPFEVTEISDGLTRRVTARTLPAPVTVTTAADLPARGGGRDFVRSMPLLAAAHLPGLPGDGAASRLALAAFAQPWPGTVLVNEASTGAALARITRRGAVGETLEPFATGPAALWDRGAGLTIRLYAGHLAGLDDLAVLAGANRIAVETDGGDWEIVGFGTAELIAPQTYRLGRLLRGQGGTVAAMGPVAAGRRVVVLDGRATVLPVEGQWLGNRLDLLAYGGIKDLIGVPVEARLELSPVLPLAPVHLRARRVGNGDIVISWIRCSRADGDGWGAGDAPLDHAPERYRLVIARDGMAVRSVQCAGPGFLYEAAMQAADFGALPAVFDFSVVQISAVFGDGHPGEGMFNG